ncbi:MAG: DUF4124 domain-containing protein [Gammaproteobacteria bacterium]|nr:DUF4124 domain-containing protein [Gammaproteobacteria bacterium]
MYRNAVIVTVIALLTTSGVALSGEIYKWTDENGNVHYVDRPTGDPSEQRIDILSRRTNNASVQASIDARRERVATREEAQTKKAEEQKAAAEAQAEREARNQRCEQSRARLERYLQSTRLYREDESGERVYLDEEQILEARAKVQDQIQEYCN